MTATVPRFKDEILVGGERLRYYFKSDEYGFPHLYGQLPRYKTRPEAVTAYHALRKRDIERDIRSTFSRLMWADLEDLYRCPDCYSVVEVTDILNHHGWHTGHESVDACADGVPTLPLDGVPTPGVD